jgi:phosphate/sulfate permease
MSSIILSWLFSPILTALLSASLFALLRCLVLRSPNAYHRAYYVLPFFVFLTFFM